MNCMGCQIASVKAAPPDMDRPDGIAGRGDAPVRRQPRRQLLGRERLPLVGEGPSTAHRWLVPVRCRSWTAHRQA